MYTTVSRSAGDVYAPGAIAAVPAAAREAEAALRDAWDALEDAVVSTTLLQARDWAGLGADQFAASVTDLRSRVITARDLAWSARAAATAHADAVEAEHRIRLRW